MRTLLACLAALLVGCGSGEAPTPPGNEEPPGPSLQLEGSELRMAEVDGRDNPRGHDTGVVVVATPCPLTSRDSAYTWVDEKQLSFLSESEYEDTGSATLVDCGNVFINSGVVEHTRNVDVVGDTLLRFSEEPHFTALTIESIDNEGHVTRARGQVVYEASYCVSENWLGSCVEERTVVDTSDAIFETM